MLTDEDFLIYRRVAGVMTQARYTKSDRYDATAMRVLSTVSAARAANQRRGGYYSSAHDWNALRVSIGLDGML